MPFIVGSLVGLLSYNLRKGVYETPVFESIAIKSRKQTKKELFSNLICNNPRLVLIGFSLTALSAVTVSLLLYLPSYFSLIAAHKNELAQQSYISTSTSFILLAVFSAFFGWLSDFFNRRMLLLVGSIASMLSATIVAILIHTDSTYFNLALTLLIPISVSIVNGVYAISIIELFPADFRSSGMGLSFNLGLALIGGISPLLFTYLINITGSVISPFGLFILCAVITFLGALKWTSNFEAGTPVTENTNNQLAHNPR